MIVEQSFFNLPEVLMGVGYREQDYEAGIVSALSLALLQELNGRNVKNPIASIKAEERYDAILAKSLKRYLRMDLSVDLDSIGVINGIIENYGWKKKSAIECKFYRSPDRKKDPTNKTAATIDAIIDLIRLNTFLGGEEWTKYFLHVHDRHPKKYFVNNIGLMQKLYISGRQTICIDCAALAKKGKPLSSGKPNRYQRTFGNLGDLKIDAKINNIAIRPKVTTGAEYWLFLTRIESSKVQLSIGGTVTTFEIDGSGKTDQLSEFEKIKQYIYERISIEKSEESETPMESIDSVAAVLAPDEPDESESRKMKKVQKNGDAENRK